MDVEGYFSRELQKPYGSELARHYQQRMLKYRNKLFTFLDYDGVPWNNNNGETAVKRWAVRRNTITAFTDVGIRRYLVLLSIYQTLRYRNVSFLRFLLSGETNVDTFIARNGR
jgi:hypothetical protein